MRNSICLFQYVISNQFQACIGDPLPAELALKDEIVCPDIYKTTNGVAHDVKHMGGVYGNQNPLYKKAPGHWKVNYVKDHHEKVGENSD